MTKEKRDKLNEAILLLLSEHYLLITDIWKQTESYIKTRFKSEK